MNRLLIIFMMVLLILSMTACGKKSDHPHRYQVTEEEQEKDDKDSDSGSDKTNEEEPEDENSEEVETSEKKAENVIADIGVSRHVEYKRDDDGAVLYRNEYEELVLTDSTAGAYEGLKVAVEDYNSENNGSGASDDLIEMAKEQKKNSDYFSEYYDYNYATVYRKDDVVFSIKRDFGDYKGGAHGFYGIDGFNYDASTGNRLSINDVIADMDGLKNAALEALSRDYKDLIESDKNVEKKLEESFDNPENLKWTMGPLDFTLYYNPYDIAAYVAGMQILNISYAEYPDVFKDGYGTTTKDYIIKASEARIDFDGDGKLDKLTTDNKLSDDGHDILGVKINTGISKKTVELYAYSVDKYIIKKGDHYYLYIEGSSDNDYRSIYMFELTGGKIKELGEEAGGVESSTTRTYYDDDGNNIYTMDCFYDPELLYIGEFQHLLSSFTGVKKCKVGDDGKIAVVDPNYRCLTDHKLTSKRDLKLKTVDASGNETGEITVPSGSTFLPIISDDKTYSDCQLEDGTLVRLPVDSSDWPHKVDGDDLENVFDGVMFAGA